VILIVLRDDRTNQKRGKIGNGGKGKTEMNSKIAITVRKRYGNAVARNRTKRILRAACRDVIPALKQGYYIIIQPKDSFKDMRFIEIRNDIKRVFSKSGVIV
jgi:ribonuclease P protein component